MWWLRGLSDISGFSRKIRRAHLNGVLPAAQSFLFATIQLSC
jgi:hypothetical protein